MSWPRIQRRVIRFTTDASPDGGTIPIVTPIIFGPDQIGGAWVAISSFRIAYGTSSSPTDHHVERLVVRFDSAEIDYAAASDEWGVIVGGEVGLRDHGAFDDRFHGMVTLLVFALGPELGVEVPIEIYEVEGTFEGGRGEDRLPTFRMPPIVKNSTRINSAHVALNSLDIQFLNGDHYLQELTVEFDEPRIRNEPERAVVEVSGRFGLRDSGDFDDPYSAFVRCLIIAEVEAP